MIQRVLVASRDASLLAAASSALADEDRRIASCDAAEGAWERLEAGPVDVLVVDEGLLGANSGNWLARLHRLERAPDAIVLLARDDVRRRAALLDAGATACVASGGDTEAVLRSLEALLRRSRHHAVRELIARRAELDGRLVDFAAKSTAMRTLLATARKVVDVDSSLLILGETGVGKEYLARAIHREGARSESPFVALNCAALPEPLLESELFGHVPGAFTGASSVHRGYFELAHRGTVFLDEIGETSPAFQAKLLRVLQDRVVQPLGSEKSFRVDVRVIAATNRDLRRELEAGRFRADLYYRLSVVALTVPPLRDRPEDLPDLVHSNLRRFRSALGRPVQGISDEALRRLLDYDWPGNVRELVNVLERAVLLSEGEELRASDLPDLVPHGGLFASLRRAPHGLHGANGQDGQRGQNGSERLTDESLPRVRERVLEELERRYLSELLERTGGRVGQAAERAGITPRALYSKMKRYGLRRDAFRRPGPEPGPGRGLHEDGGAATVPVDFETRGAVTGVARAREDGTAEVAG